MLANRRHISSRLAVCAYESVSHQYIDVVYIFLYNVEGRLPVSL